MPQPGRPVPLSSGRAVLRSRGRHDTILALDEQPISEVIVSNSVDGVALNRAALLEAGFEWFFDSTFLCHMDADRQDEVLATMSWQRHRRGAAIVEDKRPPLGLHLLVSGKAVVLSDDGQGGTRPIASLGPGHIVGERSLLLRVETSARVEALSPMLTLFMPAAAFLTLLDKQPEFRTYVTDLVTLRDRSDILMDLLLRHPFMRSLGRDDMERFVQAGRIVRLTPGERVVSVGDLTRDVYLVVSGKVAVLVPSGPAGEREHVADKGPGAMFGHAAALLRTPRTADIQAVEQTELLRVSARAMMAIIARNPTLKRRLMIELASKEIQVERASALQERAALVSIYGVRAGIGTTTIAWGLAVALRDEGKVVLVDIAGAQTAQRLGIKTSHDELGGVACGRFQGAGEWGVEVVFPEQHGDAPALVHALRDSLPARAFLLVAAESRDQVDASIMAEAETVVLVRSASESAHDEAAGRHQTRIDAVRIEPGAVLPLEVATQIVRIPQDRDSVERFWRTGDPFVLGNPVSAMGRASRRLARALTGRTVGLALGGGGALGFAHIGLLRALDSANIPIDYIAGASFGALVAGFYAVGGMTAVEDVVGRRKQLLGPLASGFISTYGFERWIDRALGYKTLGETEIPFYPVGVDVATGREVVRAAGTIGGGVRSSSGLAPAFPSLVMGTARVVDGGMHNNVPASVPWEAGAHFIVASNIIPSFPFAPPQTGGSFARRAARLALGRLDDTVRSLFLLMSQSGRDRAQLADFVFDLHLTGYNIYDFMRGDEIADAGQRQAETMLPDILYAYRSGGKVL